MEIGDGGMQARISGAAMGVVLLMGLAGWCMHDASTELVVHHPPPPSSPQFRKGCEVNTNQWIRERCLKQREERNAVRAGVQEHEQKTK